MDDNGARCRQAWNLYLDGLRVAGDELFRSTSPADSLTLAEGLRHLSRLVRIGLETNVEFSDPLFPTIFKFVDETRKFGCDNPDTIYQRAPIDGRFDYVIEGRRGTVDYLSFNALATDAHNRSVLVGKIDSSSLFVDADGKFTITVSSRPSGVNWLKVDETATSISIRQTFLDRRTEIPADLSIRRIGGPGTPAPLDLSAIESSLQSASTFVQYCASTFTGWTESYRHHVNELPAADQEKCLKAGGDPNIYFFRSFWSLGSEEALVIRIPSIPKCNTWNLQVDNYWQESMDYRYHRSNLNKRTAKYEADDSVIAVIAHRNPCVPNWLDTAGHKLGHFAMRQVKAEKIVTPSTRVCQFADVAQVVESWRGT